MKNLYTLDNVVHSFANQLEESGRNSNNSLYFEGTQLYSYGKYYLLAEIVSDDVILINSERYSNTTAKHRIKVLRGTSQYRQLDMIVRDVTELCSFFNDTYQKLIKSKKYAPSYLRMAQQMFDDYIFYFEQEHSEISIDEHNIVLNAFAPFQAEKVRQIVSKQEELISINAKRAQERARERERESLEEFRTFKSTSVRSYSGLSYLRVNGDVIETSQGVKVPINAIEHLYKAICNGVNIVGKVVNNQFTIREQDEQYIRVGCHKIEINEIKNVLSNEIK